ncbi:MAG: very short patch repair endonuclease [Bacteroidota bacterium]
MDVLTKEQRRKNMQAIRSKDTKAEKILAHALWSEGFRYRKNNKTVFGKPDLTFKKLKIAVFVDSEFFHGRDWEENKHRIQTNQEFWWKKIEDNMNRDKRVVEKLTAEGWKVLRYWDTEVHKKLRYCVLEIKKQIRKKEKCR